MENLYFSFISNWKYKQEKGWSGAMEAYVTINLSTHQTREADASASCSHCVRNWIILLKKMISFIKWLTKQQFNSTVFLLLDFYFLNVFCCRPFIQFISHLSIFCRFDCCIHENSIYFSPSSRPPRAQTGLVRFIQAYPFAYIFFSPSSSLNFVFLLLTL